MPIISVDIFSSWNDFVAQGEDAIDNIKHSIELFGSLIPGDVKQKHNYGYGYSCGYGYGFRYNCVMATEV